jgi:hypothetical protein
MARMMAPSIVLIDLIRIDPDWTAPGQIELDRDLQVDLQVALRLSDLNPIDRETIDTI